ncbi:hypothetical protein [Thalassotalea sp. Y01]|uniref:tetratricopeptide repeat protein n=1 Tax=Thalassotalea sp. Y01 TaxID=2729613 RepID=UPI00145D26CB|nr:hypothetical protein [Thalassotalea sp. Y01]NMP17446.1 hypothetical protein [Thalassotalea sp. Y01]
MVNTKTLAATPRWLNTIKRVSVNLYAAYQKHKTAIIAGLVLMLALAIYVSPQGFMNLWLSRDQQAALYLQQGKADQAATVFADKQWAAYSYFVAGEYDLAQTMFAQLDGVDARFSEASAHAYMGNIVKAISLYKQVLQTQADYPGAEENLQILEKILANAKPGKPRAIDTDEIDTEKKGSNKKMQSQGAGQQVMSDSLWLKQVQTNPEKFLRKKFQQEYINASK